MKNLYLDPTTYDVKLSGYNLRITNTVTEHLSQKIENRLKTFSGEFFANETIGLPYFQSILGKSVDIPTISGIFKEEIKAIPEVEDIISFDVTFDNASRELSIEFEVLGTDETITQGSITI